MLETEWFSGRAVDDEAKRERHELRKIIGILAVVGVIVGLFLGGWAQAAPAVEVPVYVHDSSALKAQLLAKPCEDPRVMEMLVAGMPQHASRFQRVEADFKMRSGEWKHYAGCWAELTAEEVGFVALFLLFEDGDYFLVNKAEFLAGKGGKEA